MIDDDECGVVGGMTVRKTKELRKSLPFVTLSTTNPT
jgi:hypothetical protein